MNDSIWKSVGSDAKDLIQKMMCVDVKKRVEARQALQHKWFNNASQESIPVDIIKESLKNLMSFNATQKMQQATMSMMVQ